MNLQIDQEYLVKTLADLIAINSINLSLVPNGQGEAEIAAYIGQALRRLGLDVALHDAEHSRVSAVGLLKGSGRGRSLMLNGHIDTVGVEGMDNPFKAEIRDGNVYGRGAYDMKGSVAACMTAVKALVDNEVSLSGDLFLSAVADEEYASLGSADVIKRYPVDAAIVTEPTQMNVCLAHKGFLWLEVETIGRAAHGSRFDEGIDANMRMGRFLGELDKLEQQLRQRAGHPLVGPPSLHAAMISGGTELSVYAAQCQLQIERRTIPGESEAQVLAEIQALINRLAADDPTFKATLKTLFVRNPFSVSETADIVQTVDRTATKVLGQQPNHTGETFWADAALFSEARIETVMIGPIGGGAHANVEWVDLQSLVDLAQILAETAVEFCG